jgi:hypothetical protein
MLANRSTKVVELDPPGGPVTVVIRKLSARSLDSAREADTERALRHARAMGPDMMQAFRAAAAAQTDGAPAHANRYAGLDRDTVLLAGIEKWDGDPVKGCTPAQGIAELEPEYADRLFREIVDFSVPTADEAEALLSKG